MAIPSCWSYFDPITKFLTQKKVIHTRQPIFVENKTFIFRNTSTKSMFWKKGKDGWSFTKPKDGNEKFVSKWPKWTSDVLELIVERIMQVGEFSLASSQPFCAILHKDITCQKQTKKCENFKANWIKEQKSLKPVTLMLSVVN